VVDEVAGTGVDTFSYCVERGDGIFYPSKVEGSLQFGSDKRPHTQAITWHAWECMRSLEARELNPLQLLIQVWPSALRSFCRRPVYSE
jgi:hypothetical protein